jgi:hypothetical protein
MPAALVLLLAEWRVSVDNICELCRYFRVTVGGGAGNIASGYHATIGSGMSNCVMDNYGTIAMDE